ncbi:hypothetical protein [Agromyces sp. LHK192]|uniref:YncE family protein n=1 Tax=Agromyces sp. LHK192 TaxID=2498704 RepID=UPI000FDCA45A|nr:hypothetical protein [Agromyces sp. LHK192]
MSENLPNGRLLVVNKDDDTLGIVDFDRGATVATVPLIGTSGHEVAVTPDRRSALVPIYSDAPVGVPGIEGRTIDVIDLESANVIRTVDLGGPARPHCPMFGDGWLYVTAESRNAVLVLDPATLEVVGSIDTGAAQSHMLAVSGDGSIGCTANVEPGSVSILDLTTRSLRAVVPVAAKINRIALSPDGRTAYTADQQDARLAVVDVARGRVERWIDLPAVGFGAALTPSGDLVVALRSADAVAVVDPSASDASPTRLITTPRWPQMIVLDPSGTHAYTACRDDEVAVEIDLAAGRVARTAAVGRDPDGIAWVGGQPRPVVSASASSASWVAAHDASRWSASALGDPAGAV